MELFNEFIKMLETMNKTRLKGCWMPPGDDADIVQITNIRNCGCTI